jgi:hypothetical protein
MKYYIYNPNGNKPKNKHNSYDKALNEAKRIAAKENTKVYVLAICASVEPDIKYKVVEFSSELKTKNKYPLSFKIMHTIDVNKRLNELAEIPRLENGTIDYWLASKLLCEKDGGRLPTEEELAELASYLYGVNIGPREDKYNLEIKNQIKELGEPPYFFWSSSELSASVAVRRSIGSNNSSWYQYNRSNSRYVPLCVGDLD